MFPSHVTLKALNGLKTWRTFQTQEGDQFHWHQQDIITWTQTNSATPADPIFDFHWVVFEGLKKSYSTTTVRPLWLYELDDLL